MYYDYIYDYICKLSRFSRVRHSAPPWTVGQAPLSVWILQTRTLGWVAISFSRTSSQPRDQPMSPALTLWILYY